MASSAAIVVKQQYYFPSITSTWPTWLYTALCTFGLVYCFIKFRLTYWQRRGILHAKPAFLYGHTKAVAKGKQHIASLLKTLYEQYKTEAPFIGFYMYIKPYLLVLDTELVRAIVQTDAGAFQPCKPLPLSRVSDYLLLHNERKACITPGIVSKLLMDLLLAAKDFQQDLLEWKLQEYYSIAEVTKGYNQAIVSRIVYDKPIYILPDGDFTLQQYFHSLTINCSLLQAYIALDWPALSKLAHCNNYNEGAMNNLFMLAIDKLKEDRNILHGQHLLAYLAEDEAANLSYREIAATAVEFSLESVQLANFLMTHSLQELATHADLQKMAREEIRNVLDRHNGKLTCAGVHELHLLKQILQETLRLHSPFPFMLRKCLKDYEVDNSVFMLAKGNDLLIPVDAIYRDPAIFADADCFMPERFATVTKQQLYNDAASDLPLGISGGAFHSWPFIEAQIIVGLATILLHYRCVPHACPKQNKIQTQRDNRNVLYATTDVGKLMPLKTSS